MTTPAGPSSSDGQLDIDGVTVDESDAIETIAAALATYGYLDLASAPVVAILRALMSFGLTRDLATQLYQQVDAKPSQTTIPLLPTQRQASRENARLRAQYLVNAAKRMVVAGRSRARGLQGLDAVNAFAAGALEQLGREATYLRQHVEATTRRRLAAAAIDGAVNSYGPLIGWKAKGDEKTTPACAIANGHNFTLDDPPKIGLPGMLHAGNCRCVPTRPFEGATTVNEALGLAGPIAASREGTMAIELGWDAAAHPTAPAGAPGGVGGQFVPLGAARNSSAATAQTSKTAQDDYKSIMEMDPAKRGTFLKTLDPARAVALNALLYSFKSSDPNLVSARLASAAYLKSMGLNPADYGALNGKPSTPAQKDAEMRAAQAAHPGSTPSKPGAPAKPGAKAKKATKKVKEQEPAVTAQDQRIVLDDSVSDAKIAQLRAQGWRPKPGDNVEALYPPGTPGVLKTSRVGQRAIELSAETATLAATPAPLGKTGGPGLFHMKGAKLPNYIENVRNGIMKTGVDESKATAIAIGRVRDWAQGKGKVSPEVRAASAAAIAEWDALRAKARAANLAREAGRDDIARVIELAAANGHHIAGTQYNWRHNWHPLNVQTALLWGKKKEGKELFKKGAPHAAPESKEFYASHPSYPKTIFVGRHGGVTPKNHLELLPAQRGSMEPNKHTDAIAKAAKQAPEVALDPKDPSSVHAHALQTAVKTGLPLYVSKKDGKVVAGTKAPTTSDDGKVIMYAPSGNAARLDTVKGTVTPIPPAQTKTMVDYHLDKASKAAAQKKADDAAKLKAAQAATDKAMADYQAAIAAKKAKEPAVSENKAFLDKMSAKSAEMKASAAALDAKLKAGTAKSKAREEYQKNVLAAQAALKKAKQTGDPQKIEYAQQNADAHMAVLAAQANVEKVGMSDEMKYHAAKEKLVSAKAYLDKLPGQQKAHAEAMAEEKALNEHAALKASGQIPTINGRVAKSGQLVVSAPPGIHQEGDLLNVVHPKTGETKQFKISSKGKEFPSGGKTYQYHYLTSPTGPTAPPSKPSEAEAVMVTPISKTPAVKGGVEPETENGKYLFQKAKSIKYNDKATAVADAKQMGAETGDKHYVSQNTLGKYVVTKQQPPVENAYTSVTPTGYTTDWPALGASGAPIPTAPLPTAASATSGGKAGALKVKAVNGFGPTAKALNAAPDINPKTSHANTHAAALQKAVKTGQTQYLNDPVGTGDMPTATKPVGSFKAFHPDGSMEAVSATGGSYKYPMTSAKGISKTGLASVGVHSVSTPKKPGVKKNPALPAANPLTKYDPKVNELGTEPSWTVNATDTERFKGTPLEAWQAKTGGKIPSEQQIAANWKSTSMATPAEVAAVHKYTGSFAYNINAKLRAGVPLSSADLAVQKKIDAAAASYATPVDMVVHRGLGTGSFPKENLVGKLVQDGANVSASFGTGFGGGINMTLMVPKGSHGISVKGIGGGQNDGEGEFLLPRGTQIMVHKDYYDSMGTRQIVATVVPAPNPTLHGAGESKAGALVTGVAKPDSSLNPGAYSADGTSFLHQYGRRAWLEKYGAAPQLVGAGSG